MNISEGFIELAISFVVILIGKVIFSSIEANRERIDKATKDLREEIKQLRDEMHDISDINRNNQRELYQADGDIRESLAYMKADIKCLEVSRGCKER